MNNLLKLKIIFLSITIAAVFSPYTALSQELGIDMRRAHEIFQYRRSELDTDKKAVHTILSDNPNEELQQLGMTDFLAAISRRVTLRERIRNQEIGISSNSNVSMADIKQLDQDLEKKLNEILILFSALEDTTHNQADLSESKETSKITRWYLEREFKKAKETLSTQISDAWVDYNNINFKREQVITQVFQARQANQNASTAQGN